MGMGSYDSAGCRAVAEFLTSRQGKPAGWVHFFCDSSLYQGKKKAVPVWNSFQYIYRTLVNTARPLFHRSRFPAAVIRELKCSYA